MMDYHPERVKVFRGLKPIKQFSGGRQSKRVTLLSGQQVVAKEFDSRNSKQVKGFRREVRNMKHVQGCSFVPQLLAVDKKNRVIYTSYAGERPDKYTNELKSQVRDRISQLRNKYHLTRKFHRHGLPRLANVAVNHSGNVSLIDLGPPFRRVR